MDYTRLWPKNATRDESVDNLWTNSIEASKNEESKALE
jgi:hypothetical protein